MYSRTAPVVAGKPAVAALPKWTRPGSQPAAQAAAPAARGRPVTGRGPSVGGKPAPRAQSPLLSSVDARMEAAKSGRPQTVSQQETPTPSQMGEEMEQRVAEWDFETENLDQMQEQLLNDQWRLIRTQIGALMRAVTDVRSELDFKTTHMSGEMEAVVERMMSAHEDHGQFQVDMKNELEAKAGMEARLEYLEGFVTESTEKQSEGLLAATQKLTDLQAVLSGSAKKEEHDLMSKELSDMKNSIYEHEAAIALTANADDHKLMNKQLADLQMGMEKSISNSAKKGEHASMKEHEEMATRVEYLEQFLGESAAKHQEDLALHKGAADEHKTSMETRLEFIEALLGDSSDKHAELADLHGNHASQMEALHAAIASCAQADHHSTLEQRLEYLEKFLGESADQHEKDLADHKNAHGEHKASMEARLEYMEGLMGDSADKHADSADSISTALKNHTNLEAAIAMCVKNDDHTTLRDRTKYLEDFLGESAAKHAKDLADHKDAHSEHKTSMEGRLEYLEGMMGESADNHDAHRVHKTSVETRLEFIEAMIGDSADKHATAINDILKNHGDLAAAVALCAKADHHATLEERTKYLEEFLGESSEKHANDLLNHKDAHAEHKATMEARLEYMEGLMGDSADKHTQTRDAHAEHKATMEARLEYMEGLMGDSADKHAGAAQKHASFEAEIALCAKAKQQETLEGRTKYLEDFLGESAAKHAKDLADHKGAHADHKATMEARLEYMEGLMGDSADKHADAADKHAVAAQKHASLEQEIALCAKAKQQETIEGRTKYLEDFLGESAAKHAKDLADHKNVHLEHKATMETRLEYLEGLLGESADNLAGAKSAHLEHKTSMETRLEFIEGMIGDSADKHAQALNDALKNHTDLKAAIALCARSDHHATLEERTKYLEDFLGESSEKHANDLANHKDAHAEHKATMEARLEYMEGLMGDSADKHAGASQKHASLEAQIDLCAKVTQQQTIEGRTKYLEDFLGESAAKHAQDLADHKDAHGEHKASMEARLEFLEGLLGESADNLTQARDAHAQHKEGMETRLEYLEALLGESSAKHGLHLESIADLQAAMAACAKADDHSTVAQRVGYLETFLGESADKHERDLADTRSNHAAHKTTMEQRLEYLEVMLGDSADKSAQAIGDAQKKLDNLKEAMKSCAQADHVAEAKANLLLLQSAHADHLDATRQADVKFSQMETSLKAGLEKRIGVIEEKHITDLTRRINIQEEKHVTELMELNNSSALRNSGIDVKLTDLTEKTAMHNATIKMCASLDSQSDLAKRVANLTNKQSTDLETNKTKTNDLQSKLNASEIILERLKLTSEERCEFLERKIVDGGEKTNANEILLDRLKAALDERCEFLDRRLTDYNDANTRKLSNVEAGQGRFKAVCDELSGLVRGDKSVRDLNTERLDERLVHLEHVIDESFNVQVQELEVAQSKLRDLSGKVEQQQSLHISQKTSMEQRMLQLQAAIKDDSGTKDILREMDERFQYSAEDQKRGRELLESSIQEQLRMDRAAVHSQATQVKDQWDREVKARQAHQDNYQDLLKQEHASRESSFSFLNQRIQSMEHNASTETNRIWHAIEELPVVPNTVERVQSVVVRPMQSMIGTTQQLMMPPQQQQVIVQQPASPSFRSSSFGPMPRSLSTHAIQAVGTPTAMGPSHGSFSMPPQVPALVLPGTSNSLMLPVGGSLNMPVSGSSINVAPGSARVLGSY